MTGHQGTPSTWQRSAWRNRIQSILLILFLLGLVALLGELLFGESGRWLALAAGLIAVLSAPGSRGTADPGRLPGTRPAAAAGPGPVGPVAAVGGTGGTAPHPPPVRGTQPHHQRVRGGQP